MQRSSTMMIDSHEVPALAERFEHEKPQEVLKWSLERFHPKISLASSFGAEDVVLIDMLCRTYKNPRIFTIDTGRLPQETYDLIDRIRNRYDVGIEIYFPNKKSVESMTRKHGLNLFYNGRDLRVLCCHVRKVEPLTRALSKLDAWITGLRREQAPSRFKIAKIELDQANDEMVKINPIADWTSNHVWDYIRDNKVPYNELYDKCYSSIGCTPCTRPIKGREDDRTGRWWWEKGSVKECGLHHRFIMCKEPNCNSCEYHSKK